MSNTNFGTVKNKALIATLSARKFQSVVASVALTDKIFSEALTDALKPYNGLLDIELTLDNVPQTGKGIYKMYKIALTKADTFKVFNGANDAENLYFTPDTNLLYRTLHDIDHAMHFSGGKGTTSKANELYLNCLMAKRAYNYAIVSGYTQAQAVSTFLAVYHDTVGQVHYYFKNNDFCENQKDLTNQLLSKCQGMKYLNGGSVTSARQYVSGLILDCGLSIDDIK